MSFYTAVSKIYYYQTFLEICATAFTNSVKVSADYLYQTLSDFFGRKRVLYLTTFPPSPPNIQEQSVRHYYF
jgi:hypothetical protein